MFFLFASVCINEFINAGLKVSYNISVTPSLSCERDIFRGNPFRFGTNVHLDSKMN